VANAPAAAGAAAAAAAIKLLIMAGMAARKKKPPFWRVFLIHLRIGLCRFTFFVLGFIMKD
jgi:hypothetical protein